jgi:hypothetical protein
VLSRLGSEPPLRLGGQTAPVSAIGRGLWEQLGHGVYGGGSSRPNLSARANGMRHRWRQLKPTSAWNSAAVTVDSS